MASLGRRTSCDKPPNKDCDKLSIAVGGGGAAVGGGGAAVGGGGSVAGAAVSAAAADVDAVALSALADVVAAAVAAEADASAAPFAAADADSIAEAIAPCEKWEETLAHAKTAWDNDEVVDKPSIDQDALDLWLGQQHCTFCMKCPSFDHNSSIAWISSGFILGSLSEEEQAADEAAIAAADVVALAAVAVADSDSDYC